MAIGTTNVSLSTFPAALSHIVQSGLLVGTFMNALQVCFQYEKAYEKTTVPNKVGESFQLVRDGLLSVVQDPLTPTNTGLDSGLTAATLGAERWTITMNKYGNTIDTTWDENRLAFANAYERHIKGLGQNAGQTNDLQCRRYLTYAYAGGRTHAATANTAGGTSIAVANANGFDVKFSNGVPSAVSASNALTATVNSTSTTITAYTGASRTNGSDMVSATLTLGTTATWSVGDAVIATNAPASIRPNSRTTSYTLTSTDNLVYQNIIDAVAILRNNGVEPYTDDGLYLFLGDAQHQADLHADTNFQSFYQGQYQSEEFQKGGAVVAGGVLFSFGNQPPNSTSWGSSSVTVRRGFVLGRSVAIRAIYDRGIEAERLEMNAVCAEYYDPETGVKLVVRPPLDRLNQIVSTSWEMVSGYAVTTDVLSSNGDYSTAPYKRGVLIETA